MCVCPCAPVCVYAYACVCVSVCVCVCQCQFFYFGVSSNSSQTRCARILDFVVRWKRALHRKLLGFCIQITSSGMFYSGAIVKGQKSEFAMEQTLFSG